MAPEWILRVSLGVTYVYSGWSLINHPSSWIWAITSLPEVIQKIITGLFGGIPFYLRIQGAVELLFALIFFSWFIPKKAVAYATAIMACEMLSIILLSGIDGVTFRDIGLLGGALALLAILCDGFVPDEKPV